MKCTGCGDNTDVRDSRPADIYGNETVRRRRHCPKCDARFTTYELNLEQIVRIKANVIQSQTLDALRETCTGIVREVLERTLQEDFDSKIVRYDTANRARLSRHIPKIDKSKVIK